MIPRPKYNLQLERVGEKERTSGIIQPTNEVIATSSRRSSSSSFDAV